MARYIARVRTPMSVDAAFAYLSDLRRFAEWDPGVVRSSQVEGDGPGSDAVYDVTVDNGGREMTLRYAVTEWNPPTRMKVVGKAGIFTSIDVIEVGADGDETVVVYDATLKIPFPLSLGDPILGRVFRRIGDKAAAGLEHALDGTLVA
jgi:dehydrogenase/reductase SDR family protein 12